MSTLIDDTTPAAPERVSSRWVTRSGRFRRRSDLCLAVAVGALASGLLAAELFAGSTVGMADQGDGERLACQLGLAARAPASGVDRFFRYVVLRWVPTPTARTFCEHYSSTELWFLHVARWISTALFGGPGLDLVALGILFTALFGLASGMLCRWLPGGRIARTAASIGIVLVVLDSAFAPWFVSMYSEPAGLIGLLGLAAVWCWTPKAARWQVLWVALAAATGAVFVLSLTQTLPAAVAVSLALLLHRTGLPRGWARVALKSMALGCCAVLALAGLRMYHQTPPDILAANQYDAVFGTLLAHSPNPAADLRFLGMPVSLAAFAGTDYFTPGNPVGTADPAYATFQRRFSWVRLGELWATHPAQTFALYQRTAGYAAQIKDQGLGNYTAASGQPPGAIESRVVTITGLVAPLAWAAWVLLPAFWAWAAITGLRLARRRRAEPAWRALGELVVLLDAIAITCFFVVMFSEGDLPAVSHHVLDAFATSLLVPLVILGAWGLRRGRAMNSGALAGEAP